MYTFSSKSQKMILGGDFYYFNFGPRNNIFFRENLQNQLKTLIKKYDIKDFIENVEGYYWGVKIDYKSKSLEIFGDKLSRITLYYFYNEDVFIMSDNLKEVRQEMGTLKYDENALASAFLFYIPAGFSLFKGLYRLRYNEIIKITRNKVQIERYKDKKEDTKIAEYSKKDLDKCKDFFKKAILSRASKKLNVVFASGGWDSSTVLAILTKHLGPEKVISVTENMILSDGRCLNIYEVDKAKRIAKTLGIKCEVVPIDYRSDKFRDVIKYDLFSSGLFTCAPFNWNKPINFIIEKYGEDVVVFSGDGADSLQNFGFSQYDIVLHENYNFKAYVDKMKNYLFGPTFFKKVKNNTFLNDAVYKIFLCFNQGKEFVKAKNIKDRIYYYLVSFILSDVRVPFRKFSGKGYIKERAFRNYDKWLRENYFQEVVDSIDETNLYYYFVYLYAHFHLQSPQLRTFRERFKNMRFPYVDLNLFKFMARMPENFGRGLEFLPTKYPEKELIKNTLTKEQCNIIDPMPHSYIYEEEEMNVFDEYVLKGSVFLSLKENIDARKVKKLFDNKYFNAKAIEALVKNFKQGKLKNISEVETKLLLILAVA